MANRILEQEKQKYAEKIEEYRKDLEVIKEKSMKYSNEQFQLYSKLWRSLCDLKSEAQKVWIEVNEETLNSFSKQLV